VDLAYNRKERSRRIESRGQSNAEYERLGVQRKTGKEVSRPIYGPIHH